MTDAKFNAVTDAEFNVVTDAKFNAVTDAKANAGGDADLSVVFVCLGNICRSPMAEVVFRSMLAEAGLENRVAVSSAGTGDWHIGERADRRTLIALSARGYDASRHRARQFDRDSFDQHDLVVALDRHNLADLRAMAPADRRDDVRLLRSFDPAADDLDIPDPYYGGDDGFDRALAMVEQSCVGLLEHVRGELKE